jgi:hypothetical protein
VRDGVVGDARQNFAQVRFRIKAVKFSPSRSNCRWPPRADRRFDRSAGLFDPATPPCAYLLQVFGNDRRNGMSQGFLLQISGNPATLGAGQHSIYARFVGPEGAIVQIGCVVEVAGLACGVKLHIQHLLGDRATVSILE